MSFSPDKPIQSVKDDKLGREQFVRSIVGAIRGWRGNESLVIAISGPWGSGKSSVLNMVKDLLSQQEKDKPQISEFNPWQWAGQEQLAEAFFSQIEFTLSKTPPKDRKKNTALWRLYAARLGIGSFVATSASTTVTRMVTMFLGTGLAGVGGTLSFFLEHSIVGIVVLILSVVIFASSWILPWASDFAAKMIEVKEAYEAVYDRGVEDIKAELRKQLEKLPQPVLVIVDDIDRLTASQIGLLFQLIKANADFPNMIYLLLMEKQIVAQSLDSLTVGNGKYYLQKIVQMSFDLPMTPRGKLIQILEQETLELLNDAIGIKRFDADQWASALPTISPYFRTLRDVHCFTNVLAFDLSVLRDDQSISVNVVDLICLVVLKTFQESVYKRLPQAKSVLTREHFVESESEQVNLASKAILSAADAECHGDLLNLLGYLFPAFPWNADRFFLGGFNELEALSDLRIYHPKNFDRYFIYSIETDDISAREFDELLSTLSDRTAVRNYFLASFRRGVLVSVFERFAAYSDKLETQYIEPVLTALFDIADECLPEWEDGARSVLDRFYLALSSKLLMRVESFDQRLDILSSSIEHTTGLYLPVAKVWIEDLDNARRSLALRDDQLQPLRTSCTKRIQEWAISRRLIRHSALGFLLTCWKKWDESNGWKDWVVAQTARKEGLLALCSAFLGRTVSTEGVSFYVQLDLLEKMVDIELLGDKLSLLDKTQLTGREIGSINLFALALQERRDQEGKRQDSQI